MMHKAQALQTAVFAVAEATDGEPVTIRNSAVVVGFTDGEYWVTDNGEEVDNLSREQAIKIIIENLTSDEK